MTFNELWLFIKDVTGALTPLLIAAGGWYFARSDKQNKKLKAAEAALKEQQLSQTKKDAEDQSRMIKFLADEVKDLKRQITDLNIPDILLQIKNLAVMSQANFEYSQSLSRVVVSLGTVLEETNASPESKLGLRENIKQHQNEEKDIAKKLYSLNIVSK